MKSKVLTKNLMCLSAALAVVAPSFAGPNGSADVKNVGIVRTERDILGGYGTDIPYRRNATGKIAKLDLDGDFNYDGVIDNYDPGDNGLAQVTSPGMVLGKGEMTRMVIRLSPYQLDIDTRVRFEFSACGVNRGDKTGRFESLEQELSAVGHVRIWADAGKTKLLIDSSKADQRVFNLILPNLNPENTMAVPRAVYVEGIKPSGTFSGDIRLLVRIVDVRADEAGQKRGLAKLIAGVGFRPSYDHVILTVADRPHAKSLVSAGDIWSK
jgi:hypothetical protein